MADTTASIDWQVAINWHRLERARAAIEVQSWQRMQAAHDAWMEQLELPEQAEGSR